MKIWQRKLALALVLVMVFMCVSPAFALTDAEIHRQVVNACIAEKENLGNIGKYSSRYLNQSIIDLTYVSQGTVISYTYIGDNQDLSINTHIVNSQTNSSAADKITHFVFQIRNMYYPDNAVGISVSQDRNTVHTVTYGPQKEQTIYAIISGLQECLNNEPIRSSGSSRNNDITIERSENDWLKKYSPENIKKTLVSIIETLSISPNYSTNPLISIIVTLTKWLSKD